MKNFIKIVLIAIITFMVVCVLEYAPNFENDGITDRTNLVINYTNVTAKMKGEIFIDNEVIYLSKEDIKNYFDEYLYIDEQYNQIITTADKSIAYISIDKNGILVDESTNISGNAISKGETVYIPISKLEKVYNIEITYIEETDTVVIESLDKEAKMGTANKKSAIKYKPTSISKTIDKVNENETVKIVPLDEELDGWLKVRTEKGILGYIKKENLSDIVVSRNAEKQDKQIDGNISIVWEYFSEYGQSPDRNGTTIPGVNVVSPSFFYIENGKLKENVGETGKNYIEWAHSNDYKVWPMVANNSNSSTKKEAFSKIINDSKLRKELIEDIVDYVEKYDLDGINLDFENMYEKDKDMFSRFVIELAPRLKNMGVVFSVDVTAPDGAPDWSLCFNRHVIGDVADYIVFMAYDQHSTSSKTAGTVAGYDWVEKSINKFLTQEEVPAEKIILAMPFYTRLWKETESKLSSSVVSMKNVDRNIPEGVDKIWNEECKQYYIEYEKLGETYKMWIEDEKSLEHKINLIQKYNLAGGAFWVKGFESESIWNLIDENL